MAIAFPAAFGTLIFEMLCGCPPFYSRNLHAMYRAILTAELRIVPSPARQPRALDGPLTAHASPAAGAALALPCLDLTWFHLAWLVRGRT